MNKFFKQKKRLVLIFVLLALFMSMTLKTHVNAQVYQPWLEVAPGLVERGPNPPSVMGTEFTVRLEMKSLDQTLQLFNVSFALTFDSTLLEALTVTEGGFMRGGDPNQKTVFNSTILTDRVIVNQYYIDEAPENTTYPSGNGTLAMVDFNITYQGEYPAFDESALTIIDIVLTDKDGSPVQVDTEKIKHGLYRINGLAHPKISAIGNFTFFTNTTFLGNRFNATFWVYDIADLFAWQVRLDYNTSQLVVTKIVIPSQDPLYVFNGRQTFPIPFNGTDYVIMGDTIIAGKTFNGTGKLGIIEFEILQEPQVAEIVSSNLSLDNEDTYLVNSEARKIPANKTNRLYSFIWVGSSTIGIDVTPSSAIIGSTVTISGAIVPLSPNRNVTIFYRLNTTGTWSKLATVMTDSNSYYTYNWTTTNVGTYELKANWTGFQEVSGAESDSAVLILTVTLSTITLRFDPATVTVGSDIILSGTVAPTQGKVEVTLYYRPNLTEYWTLLSTVETDSDGNYTYTWTTIEADTFQVKATWLGDDSIAGAESNIETVIIKAKPPTDISFYAIVGTGIIVAIAVAVAIYLLKIRKS